MMISVIEKMEQKLIYLESLSPKELSSWASKQKFEYDPMWDDIFDFGGNNIPDYNNFVILCENYNNQIAMSSCKITNLPKVGRYTSIEALPYGCIFDAITEAA